MRFDIPNSVRCVAINAPLDSWGDYRDVCFRHAVMRAIRGEIVDLHLTVSHHTQCADCRDEKEAR